LGGRGRGDESVELSENGREMGSGWRRMFGWKKILKQVQDDILIILTQFDRFRPRPYGERDERMDINPCG